MSPANTLFIVNHLSERVARKGSVLEAISGDTQTPLHTLGNFEDLPDTVLRAAKNKTPHIFIEGGDGTVQSVLTAFLRRKDQFEAFPTFSIVPGGMTNQVAKNIGLISASRSLIEKTMTHVQAPTSTVPLLSVAGPDHDPFYGFLFSTGGLPMITEYTKSNIHNKGIGGSLAVAGGILRGISGKREDVMYPTEITLELNGQTISEDHLGTVVTTLPGLILGLDPFWGTEDAPLRVTYGRGDTRRLYKHVAGLWAGQKSKDRSKDGLKSWNTHKIDYHYSGPVVLDGEALDFPSHEFSLTSTDPIGFVY